MPSKSSYSQYTMPTHGFARCRYSSNYGASRSSTAGAARLHRLQAVGTGLCSIPRPCEDRQAHSSTTAAGGDGSATRAGRRACYPWPRLHGLPGVGDCGVARMLGVPLQPVVSQARTQRSPQGSHPGCCWQLRCAWRASCSGLKGKYVDCIVNVAERYSVNVLV